MCRRYRHCCYFRCTAFLVLGFTLQNLLFKDCFAYSPTTISVCQNKDCCQRFVWTSATLVQTIQHLLPLAHVESTGCLGHCGMGPAIQIGNQHFLHLETPDAIAFVLPEIHPTLLAATKVMERASKAKQSEEQDRCLTSVITTLAQKSDFMNSRAKAHAHVMRSQVKIVQEDWIGAKDDVLMAITIHPDHMTAWRTLADIEEGLNNPRGAMEALQQWAIVNPLVSTKVAKEMERLKCMYNRNPPLI